MRVSIAIVQFIYFVGQLQAEGFGLDPFLCKILKLMREENPVTIENQGATFSNNSTVTTIEGMIQVVDEPSNDDGVIIVDRTSEESQISWSTAIRYFGLQVQEPISDPVSHSLSPLSNSASIPAIFGKEQRGHFSEKSRMACSVEKLRDEVDDHDVVSQCDQE